MNDEPEAAAVGLRRGCDLNCGGVYQRWLMEAVEKGFIDESEIALDKGGKQTVTFKLNALEDLRYCDATQQRYIVEPGALEIQIGASSADIREKGTITAQ